MYQNTKVDDNDVASFNPFLLKQRCLHCSSLFNITGFKEPQLSLSAGGNALCISGHLPLSAKANYSLMSYPQPSNQLEFTDYLTLLITNTSLLSSLSTVIETRNVSQTLWGKLYFQTNSTKRIRTIIFLTHGATLDHNYWDLAPGYSYVDSATAAGYATFSYDRLALDPQITPIRRMFRARRSRARPCHHTEAAQLWIGKFFVRKCCWSRPLCWL